MPKPLCVLPFIHVYFDAQDVLAPCCAYDTHPDRYRHRPVSEFEQWWTGDLEDLRQDMLAQRQHPNCSRCWSEESRGLTSYRQHQNRRWQHYADIQQPLSVPVFQMIAPGNFCNLKCIMCSPHLSSAWGVEYERNQTQFKTIGIDYNNYRRGFWNNKQQAYSVLEQTVPQAESLHIMGGEPLLNPDCLRILQQVVNPEHIELIVSTNLTALTPAWIDVFQRFQTRVIVSVEGVGAKNDYIRAGSDWAVIDANIAELNKHSIGTDLSTAFGRPSLSSYPELLQYAIDRSLPLHTNMLFWPDYLQVRGAAEWERNHFFDQINKIDISRADTRPSVLSVYLDEIQNLDYDAELDAKFQQYIGVLDHIYQKDYWKIFYATA